MFKDKTAKKRVTSNKDISTLDAMHNKIINNYSNKIIAEKKNLEKIKELENTYNYINGLIINYNNDGNDLNINNQNNNYNYNDLWTSNIKIKEEIIKIKEELKDIKNFNEIEYYEKTSYILFNYYDMIEKQTTNQINNPPTKIKSVKFKNKSIIDSFKLNIENKDNDKDNDKDNENDEFNEKHKDDNYDSDELVIEKSSLVDEYLAITNNNHIKKIDFDNRELCRNCRNYLTCLQHEAIMICNVCGYQEPLLVEQNRPILKQNTKDTSHFSYKRINHFREWCNQVQGKESTDIPNDIFEFMLSLINYFNCNFFIFLFVE